MSICRSSVAAAAGLSALFAASSSLAQSASRGGVLLLTPVRPSVVAVTPVTPVTAAGVGAVAPVAPPLAVIDPIEAHPVAVEQLLPDLYLGLDALAPAQILEQEPITLSVTIGNLSRRPHSGYVRAALRGDRACGRAPECGPLIDSAAEFVFLPGHFERTLQLALIAPDAGLGYDLVVYYVEGEGVSDFEAAQLAAFEVTELDVAALYRLQVTGVHVDGPRSTRSDDLRIVMGTPAAWSTELPPLLANLHSGDSVPLSGIETQAVALYPSPDDVSGFGALVWNLGGAYATNAESSIDRERFATVVDGFFGTISELASESPELRQTDLGQLAQLGNPASSAQAQNTLLALLGSAFVPLFTTTTCDGVVAPLAFFADGEVLDRETRGSRVLAHDSDFVGTPSPVICGQASRYTLSWRVVRGNGAAFSQGALGDLLKPGGPNFGGPSGASPR